MRLMDDPARHIAIVCSRRVRPLSLPIGNKGGSGGFFLLCRERFRPVPYLRGSRIRGRLPIHPFGLAKAVTREHTSSRSKWELGMALRTFSPESPYDGIGKTPQELAQLIEGHVNRVANGRI